MSGNRLTWRCAPDITWVRDAGQILVVDSQRGLSWSLQGAEAATWDWLTLAYPYDKIVRFLSLLWGASTDDARRMLVTTLRGWQDKGIVQVMGDGGLGEPGDQCCL
jgi:hypothetical protein